MREERKVFGHLTFSLNPNDCCEIFAGDFSVCVFQNATQLISDPSKRVTIQYNRWYCPLCFHHPSRCWRVAAASVPVAHAFKRAGPRAVSIVPTSGRVSVPHEVALRPGGQLLLAVSPSVVIELFVVVHT